MDHSVIYSEFFDRYLKNQLSAKERAAFEEKVAQDPLLLSEIRLQKEICAALGETRKAALKTRLNQVPVSHTGWIHMQGSKLALVLGSALVITAGSYFYYTSRPVRESQPTLSITALPPAVDQAPVLVPEPSAGSLEQAAGKKDAPADNRVENKNTRVIQLVEKSTPEEHLPAITRPELVTGFAEDSQTVHYQDFVPPGKATPDHSPSAQVYPDIENRQHRLYDFHYQFLDNKLFLYGDFGQTPYEIIALNLAEGRHLFLKYDTRFYTIDSQQTEVAPLQAIEDSVLINALKNIHTRQ